MFYCKSGTPNLAWLQTIQVNVDREPSILLIELGCIDLAHSGVAELGVHWVYVHSHILPGEEAKHVPSKELVLKRALANFQTFCRLCKRGQFYNRVVIKYLFLKYSRKQVWTIKINEVIAKFFFPKLDRVCLIPTYFIFYWIL